MKKTLGFFIIGVFTVIFFMTWRMFKFINTSPSLSSQKVIFEVKKGSGFFQIAKKLQKENLITNVKMFYLLTKFKNKEKDLRVGEYSLDRNMFPSEILDIVSSGKSRIYNVTFQEGLNIFEMADHLEKRGLGKRDVFLKICHDSKIIKELLGFQADSLEGYLFPETYKITKYTGELSLIKLMNHRFREVFSSIDYLIASTVKKHKLNSHDVVTLASIVEKEAGKPEERPVIASVFFNRLKRDMRLQTDPTTIYGLWLERGERPFNITKKDLRQKNPYNTYTFRGLPKGPISNPGEDALLAVLKPRKTNFLYFVSRNDGTTMFSENYKQHQKAVQRFQLNRKARQGKSWRDLNKNK